MNFVKTGKYFFGFNIMINISFKEAHSGLFKLPIRYTCFLGGVGEQVDFVTCSAYAVGIRPYEFILYYC